MDELSHQIDTGTVAWYCDIGEIASLQSKEWEAYMGLLTPAEQERVLKYRFDDDRRRALVSALLQRWLVRNKLGVEQDASFEILRTPENKPYAFCKSDQMPEYSLGFWNYNLSHHGRYVGLASHATRLMGVDIVDITTRTKMVNTAHAYAMLFKGQLHPEELQAILAQSSEQQSYALFFVIWSLKESFIKAVGLGLGYDLQTVRFSVYYQEGAVPVSPESPQGIGLEEFPAQAIAGYATVRIDGKERAMYRGGAYRNAEEMSVCTQSGAWDIDYVPPVPPSSVEIWPEDSHSGLWTFDFFSLDPRHVISVAQGPLVDSLRSYKLLAWGGRSIPTDLIPRSGNLSRPGLADVAEVSTETDTADAAGAAGADSAAGDAVSANVNVKPPSPCSVDADGISGENAAALQPAPATKVVSPSQVFASVEPPGAIQLSVRDLLPRHMQRALPAPEPLSPPATDLNNRYDPSVLLPNPKDSSESQSASDKASPSSSIELMCASPSATDSAKNTGNALQFPVSTATAEMPLSPSACLNDPKPGKASPRGNPDLTVATYVDWKTMPLPSRNINICSDFNSPAGWRNQTDKPSSAEIDRIQRQTAREVHFSGGAEAEDCDSREPSRAPLSVPEANTACQSVCVIM